MKNPLFQKFSLATNLSVPIILSTWKNLCPIACSQIDFCVNKAPQSIHWEALWGVADSERWMTKWKPQTVRVQCDSVAVSQRHSVTVRQCDTAVWECESVTVSQCSVTVSPVLVPSLHRRVHLCFSFQPLWPPIHHLRIWPFDCWRKRLLTRGRGWRLSGKATGDQLTSNRGQRPMNKDVISNDCLGEVKATDENYWLIRKVSEWFLENAISLGKVVCWDSEACWC